MFPYETENKIIIEEVEEKEYGIDFKTGQLTGKIVTGTEVIKVWVWLALYTERYKYQQYSWNYGNEIISLIGQSMSPDYINATIERMITECLTVHPKITGIENLECDIEETRVTATFTINTEYGKIDFDYDNQYRQNREG